MSNITPPRFRRRVQVGDWGESLTEQEHRNSVEIHHILARYRATGLVEHTNQFQGQYLDMASAPDFQEAQNIIANANSMFETLPSDLRLEFDNDPAKFLGTMQNPENREYIESLGLDTSHFDDINPNQPPPQADQDVSDDHVPTNPATEPHPWGKTENTETDATN